MSKDKEFVIDLAYILRKSLQDKYGYCGVMESDNCIMLNSGIGNIKIKLEWEDEAPKEGEQG